MTGLMKFVLTMASETSGIRSSIGECLIIFRVLETHAKLVLPKRYNLDYGLPGTRPGGEPPEWELFDCQEDPLELMNQYENPAYSHIVKDMTALLDRKMLEIGDVPEHGSLRNSLGLV